jgi:hypothetical protein
MFIAWITILTSSHVVRQMIKDSKVSDSFSSLYKMLISKSIILVQLWRQHTVESENGLNMLAPDRFASIVDGFEEPAHRGRNHSLTKTPPHAYIN